MGPHIRSNVRLIARRTARLIARPTATFALAVGLLAPLHASAAAPVEPLFDLPGLTALEHEAEAAAPRDRCFLYTELLHGWTELAGRSMAAGDDSLTATAIAHADADAERLKIALAADSRRLKNAELLLGHTVHHLSDMLRVSSSDQRDTMQAALKHMSNVHDALLAQIFAH